MKFFQWHALRPVGYAMRQTKRSLDRIIFWGKKFFCPLCKHTYRKFLTGGENHEVLRQLQVVGAGRRDNMVCPGCLSTDRDRLLHTFLCHTDFVNFPEDKLLHIAPEPALYAWFKKKYRNNPDHYVAGVKYHEGFYYDMHISLLDLTSLPFEDESFDIVMANHVLEHIPDDKAALSEIYRVLKPKGKAVLQVPWSPLLDKSIEESQPLSPDERIKQFGQYDHVRLYGRDYPLRLKNANLNPKVFHLNDLNADENYLELIAINRNEVIFTAEKYTKP